MVDALSAINNGWRALTKIGELDNLRIQNETDFSLFQQLRYFRAFCSSLPADPRVLALFSGSTDADCVLPAFLTNAQTYPFFSPQALIYALLERHGQHALIARLGAPQPSEALVSAIPFAYVSPLSAVPVQNLMPALDAFESAAAAEGLDTRAVLYLSENDVAGKRLLNERGYRMIKLEANAVLKIDSAWSSIDAYFGRKRHGRKERKEWSVFRHEGYRCTWHNGLNDRLVNRAVELELLLMQEHKTGTEQEELYAWYSAVRDTLPTEHLVLEVANAGFETVAVLTFLRDGTTLVGKAIGIIDHRKHGLYFCAAYYEPIRFCIEYKYDAIDYGPSAGKAKRLRGAEPVPLWGAFKFKNDHPFLPFWSEISGALDRGYERLWGTQ
jgi:Peptidogalycan biosysnthesis/recognition